MFTPEPAVRFLLRGSALVMVALSLWWVALRTPLLFLLRWSESALLRSVDVSPDPPINVDASGDWNFRVPVNDTPGTVQGEAGRLKFRAMRFTMPGPDVVLFTFSVPMFWAIMLAVPWRSPGLAEFIPAFIWGTVLVFSIEVLSLLANAEMTAYGAAAQLHRAAPGLAAWCRDYGASLLVGVIPFVAPLLAAVALNHNLRSQIFAPQDVPARQQPR